MVGNAIPQCCVLSVLVLCSETRSEPAVHKGLLGAPSSAPGSFQILSRNYIFLVMDNE